MKSVATAILEFARQSPEGQPFTAKSLLQFGTRQAVDQALSRLAREGKLLRADRGVYVQPVQGKFGVRAPSPEVVVRGVAQAKNEVTVRHGASAANLLGLSTQVPMREVFLTSGRSRVLNVGMQKVELVHAPKSLLSLPEKRAGDAIRAMEWLGPENAPSAIARLKAKLDESECREIASQRPNMPIWLAEAVSKELVSV